MSCSRNLGLNLATQDWIWFIDADDFVDEVSIKKLKETVRGNNHEIVFFDWEKCNEKGEAYKTITTSNTPQFLSPVAIYKKIMKHEMENFCWDFIINKRIIHDNNLRFPNGATLLEDMLFVWKAISYANGIIHVHDKFYNYRIHSDSSSASMNSKKDKDACKMTMRLMYFLKKNYPCICDDYSIYMLSILIPRIYAYIDNKSWRRIMKPYIKKYTSNKVLISSLVSIKIKVQYVLLKSNLEKIVFLWRSISAKC